MSSVPGSAAGTSRPCVFRVVRVSGTMRKSEEEAIRRARRAILRMKQDEDEGVWNVLLGADGGRSHTSGPRGSGEKDDHISDAEFGMDVDSEDESVDEG
jgi:ribonuclease P/MRP protein subunit POP5